MKIDFVNTSVSEGATILAAIFNNLQGILSRPVAFFSSIFSNRSRTMSILGVFRENELSEGDKNDPASTSQTGISRASIFAMLVKCTLKASAISSALFIVLLLAWISKILDDLQLFRAKLVNKIPSFTWIACASFQVFRKISFFSKFSCIIHLVPSPFKLLPHGMIICTDRFLFKNISSAHSEQ